MTNLEKVLLTHPVARAEYRSPTGSIQASPVFEPVARSVRPASQASADSGEKRRKQSAAPGGLFFRGFLLAEQKKATQGAGAEPPAISF